MGLTQAQDYDRLLNGSQSYSEYQKERASLRSQFQRKCHARRASHLTEVYQYTGASQPIREYQKKWASRPDGEYHSR